jgi:MazG family protein
MGVYLAQLHRLKDLSLTTLIPSHGSPIAHVHGILDHYITHRQKREDQILHTLHWDWISLTDLVHAIYTDVPSFFTQGQNGGLAGRSLCSHLIQLEKTGQVDRLHSNRYLDKEEYWRRALIQPLDAGKGIERLIVIMMHLRQRCAWDQNQTLDSLKRYLLEETYEVLDALHLDDCAGHQDELGDLLLQIVFQSQIRKEENAFQLADVIQSITHKLVRRHPHVFQHSPLKPPLSSEEIRGQWEQIKAQEKQSKRSKEDQEESAKGHIQDSSLLIYDVPQNAPPLLRAQRIGEKAASVGFDWPDIGGALDKIREEIQEIKEALITEDQEEIKGEVGDLFFALVNLCRWLQFSPSDALEQTNRKFQNRFAHIERTLAQNNQKFEDSTLDDLENLWQDAKYKEKK